VRVLFQWKKINSQNIFKSRKNFIIEIFCDIQTIHIFFTLQTGNRNPKHFIKGIFPAKRGIYPVENISLSCALSICDGKSQIFDRKTSNQ
jgi:hypothetical protein